jgi:hypothetical protein
MASWRKSLVVSVPIALLSLCSAACLYGAYCVADWFLYLDKERVSSRTTLTKFTFAGGAECLAFSTDGRFLVVGANSFRKREMNIWHSSVRVWAAGGPTSSGKMWAPSVAGPKCY